MRARIRRHRCHLSEGDTGFTLTELLVVIIIIGVLAAIAIPVYLNQRKRGYEASEKSDLRTAAQEIESYYSATPDYSLVGFGSAFGAPTRPTISGPSVTVGNDVMSLSRNNTLTLLAAGINGYCLSAANSLVSSGPNWYYDSLGGGITRTPCPQAGKTY